ncbi:ribonuclease HII [Mycoplasma anatis]|uniref:Ribonuclease HII n=2 Tax=Mycoplasmopsis anatis TaxID=171279 RepID=A0A9Q3QFZ4_9BACT|nr:ribonuclease HII [Mycoplasmopsis anatis]MBW0602732.1 ribonuclease HII [Mycoplasmopsis anatis]
MHIINYKMDKIETELWNEFNNIIGVDEVGRGCIAGPMVVASVILPKNYVNNNIDDSKKLTKNKREAIYQQILKDCLFYKIVFIDVEQVEKLNPKQSSILGMQKAIIPFLDKIDLILTDFEKVNLGNDNIKEINLVKGDSKSLTIAAASILAKVTRDNFMSELSKTYPEFKWDDNYGYGTKAHIEAIKKHGYTQFHRKTFEPIKSMIKENIISKFKS